MTQTPVWRLKDKIIEEYYVKLGLMTPPTALKLSKITLANLGIEMNVIGEINMFFGMPILIDDSIAVGTYVLVL